MNIFKCCRLTAVLIALVFCNSVSLTAHAQESPEQIADELRAMREHHPEGYTTLRMGTNPETGRKAYGFEVLYDKSKNTYFFSVLTLDSESFDQSSGSLNFGFPTSVQLTAHDLSGDVPKLLESVRLNEIEEGPHTGSFSFEVPETWSGKWVGLLVIPD